jgi:hypothetical protein
MPKVALRIPSDVRRQLRRGKRVTQRERDELDLCSPKRGPAGFLHWLEHYAHVQDRKTKRDVPFVPFRGQRRVIPDLVIGLWVVLLKGRQLGLTWLIAAYAVWRITFESMYTVTVVNQSLEYAQDFVWRVRYIYDRLPAWQRKRITRDSTTLLRFEANRNFGEIRAVAGSAKAGRSMSGDLVVLDEASRIDALEETMQALQPQIDVGEGQIVMLSSSAGPQGIFYETWRENYGEYGEMITESGVGPSGFKPIFLHWSERPGRDAEWYAKRQAELAKVSPVAIKQEYPDNPQEAWEYASGRVYPLFNRDSNIGDVEIPSTADRFRAIDWGQSKSAQVCLWLAHLPGHPGLLISPKCHNTIREFFAYRWDPDDPQKVLKEDDHTCDALRYAVTTFALTGLVYVYREMYIEDPVAKGWNPMREIEEIHHKSGWDQDYDTGRWQVTPTGELFSGTVADRSWKKMISLFNLHDLDVQAHRRITGPSGKPGKHNLAMDPVETEVKEGIRLVSALIDGTIEIERWIDVTRTEMAKRVALEDAARRVRANIPLDRRAMALVAKRLARRRRT